MAEGGWALKTVWTAVLTKLRDPAKKTNNREKLRPTIPIRTDNLP